MRAVVDRRKAMGLPDGDEGFRTVKRILGELYEALELWGIK